MEGVQELPFFHFMEAARKWNEESGPYVESIGIYETLEKEAGVVAAETFESKAFRDSMSLERSCSL